jgi:hypothetical protein
MGLTGIMHCAKQELHISQAFLANKYLAEWEAGIPYNKAKAGNNGATDPLAYLRQVLSFSLPYRESNSSCRRCLSAFRPTSSSV